MPRSTGWKPSPPNKVGLGPPHHLSALPPPPPAAEVALPPPVDQGGASSCTGNAGAVAICVAMAQGLGHPSGPWPELPSRLFLYYDARAAEGEANKDGGAYIHDIFEMAVNFGFPPESAWSYSDAFDKVIAQPDWEAYRAAADQRYVKGAYRITSAGAELIEDVKRAIAAGHPVVWGTELDQAFEDLAPGAVWPGVTGPVIGGHAMILHRYDGDVFWTRSSWGNWCEGGSARISAAAVMSGGDFWIVALAPEWSGT